MKNEIESKDMAIPVDKINQMIRGNDIDTNGISDGYHTFEELYHHRSILYIALLSRLDTSKYKIWYSDKHYDGAQWDEWILVCAMDKSTKEQISYHVSENYRTQLEWINKIQYFKQSPYEFDGHSSIDVVERLQYWFMRDDWRAC